ncbi:MAG: hypothetical protein KIS92_16125 [Planctomycetota bacterium]|nr:hypothetical protein [Planctomycetota bacterium]
MRSLIAWLLNLDDPSVIGPDSELSFRFNQSPEGWAVFLLVVAVIGFTIWIYRKDGRETATPGFRTFLGVLRAALIAIALLMLAEPVLVSSHNQTKPSTVVVLLDNSYSMSLKFPYADDDLRKEVQEALGKGTKVSIRDENGKVLESVAAEKLELKHYGAISRMQVACAALRKGTPGFLEDLKKKHGEVRLYTFSRGLTTADEENKPLVLDKEKDFETPGQETRMGDCMRQVIKELRGMPLAGVVVITDGRQNAGEDPVHVATTQFKLQRIPVYTVSVGDPGEPKDIELNVEGPEAILPDDPAEVVAHVRQKGFESLKELTVDMKEGDKVIASDRIKVGKSGEKVAVPLKFRVQKPGKYTYTISVPRQEGELRPENNEATYTFQVVDKKVKVLLAEGQDLPRWEYRYLKNALIRDHTTEADVLLATNEEQWIYDGSPGKPAVSFPQEKKDFGEYDVIILGDINPMIFTKDQIARLQEFVREGGGLIMIAGERFMPSSYITGPLGEMLPVVPQPAAYQTPSEGFQEQFPIELTAEGKRLTWTQLDPEDSANRETWENLPKQLWFYPVKRAKEGATTVASHPFAKDDAGKKMPLIATLPYGLGRVMYVGVDSLWRWRKGVGDRYHYRFYSQAIRYLSSAKRLGGQKRFAVDVDKTAYAIGDKVTITARVKDEKFNPLTAEKVTVYMTSSKGKLQTMELDRKRDSEGEYTGVFFPSQRDDYSIWLKDDQQPDVRQSEITFKVDVPQLELDNPRMNEELLKAVAAAGGEGGKYFGINQLDKIPALIQPKEEKILHEIPINLWDNWMAMFVFTLLITLEWVLRKKGRMI